MELNPILTRESRARWRRQAFLLLFFGASLFAVVMYFCYQSSTLTWEYTPQGNYAQVPQQASAVGPALFRQLSLYHIIGWMLLAPLLTATTLAGERERGLLEGLQLSQLTPGAIVRGKLYSALSFAALIVLALLPIIAICFLLGGVSPGEFVGAALQTFVAALLGTSIGLWVSSRSRRAAQAVANTIGLIILWSLGAFVALVFTFWWPTTWIGIQPVLLWLSLLNPGITLFFWLNGNTATPPLTWTPFEPWLLGCLMQLLLSLWLLFLSAKNIKKPLPEEYWVEIGPATQTAELLTSQAPHESQTGQILPTRTPRERWELPFVKHIHVANPILQRDLRAKFIFRRVPLPTLMAQGALMLLLVGLYLWMVWLAYFDYYDFSEAFPLMAAICALLLLLLPAMRGAAAFTRERETGTWQSIRLSLLSPLEIIMGKQIGAVSAAAFWSLTLLPFIYPALQNSHGYSWQQIALTFLYLFALAWASAAWGMRISWSTKKSATAAGWTIGSLFIALMVLPPFVVWFADDITQSHRLLNFVELLHPAVCFGRIFDGNAYNIHRVAKALIGIVFLFGLGCLLLINLFVKLSGNSEQDENH